MTNSSEIVTFPEVGHLDVFDSGTVAAEAAENS